MEVFLWTGNRLYIQSRRHIIAAMNLQERLKVARKAAKLTQTQLAERAGIAKSTYSELETGVSQGTKYLFELASVLGVSAQWLQSGEGAISTIADLEDHSLLAEKIINALPELDDTQLELVLSMVDQLSDVSSKAGKK